MVGDSEKVHSKLSKKSSLAELAEISDFHNQRHGIELEPFNSKDNSLNHMPIDPFGFTLIFTSHLF